MTRQLQNWGADRLTPTSVTDQWRKGGFALKVMTRSVATERQGTCKTMRCVGRNSDEKVACGFKVVCEFVKNVQSSTSIGWVLKEVSREAHECANGERHDLNIRLAQVKTHPKSARAIAQLELEPFKSLGLTLKNAYLGVMSIDKALKEKALEANLEPRWNLDQLRSQYGITVMEEILDFKNVLLVLTEQTEKMAAAMHHTVRPHISVMFCVACVLLLFAHRTPCIFLSGIRNDPTFTHFQHDANFPHCHSADPKDVVFIFDTTYGTNIYGISSGFSRHAWSFASSSIHNATARRPTFSQLCFCFVENRDEWGCGGRDSSWSYNE